MKNLLGLLLTLFLGLCLPGRAAAEWLLISENPDGNRAYINNNSLRREGSFAWFWISLRLSQFEQPKYDPVETVLMYLSADCTTGQTRLRQMMFYDKNEKLIYSKSPGDKGPSDFISSSEDVLYDALQHACR